MAQCGCVGGLDEDFGIKFNCENGGPAPEKVTEKIFANTVNISEYKICKGFPNIDLTTKGTYLLEGKIRVDVFDCAEDHIGLLMKVFDFEGIKKLIARKDFSPVLIGAVWQFGLVVKQLQKKGEEPVFLMSIVLFDECPRHGLRLNERSAGSLRSACVC